MRRQRIPSPGLKCSQCYPRDASAHGGAARVAFCNKNGTQSSRAIRSRNASYPVGPSAGLRSAVLTTGSTGEGRCAAPRGRPCRAHPGQRWSQNGPQPAASNYTAGSTVGAPNTGVSTRECDFFRGSAAPSPSGTTQSRHQPGLAHRAALSSHRRSKGFDLVLDRCPRVTTLFDGTLRASPSTVKRREPSKTWMDDGPVRVMFLLPSSAMPSVPVQCWPDPTDNAGDGRIRKPPRRTVPRSARQTKGVS